MQIIGMSAAALSSQPLNPVFFVRPEKKPEPQAAPSTTILLASSSQSNQTGQSQNTFMYMASSSGGITIVEEMMLSTSFSATADGYQSSSSFIEIDSVSSNSGTDVSYASAATLSFSASESNLSSSFRAMA